MARSYRRRRYRKARPSYSACGKMVARDGYKLYKTISPYLPLNSEYKQKYIYPNFVSTGSGVITDAHKALLLNGLSKGTESYNRIGQSIRMTSINYKFTISINASATTPTLLRICIILDRYNNGNDLTTTNVWANGMSTHSQRLNGFQQRYKILKDMTVLMDPSNRQAAFREGYIKLPKQYGKVQYNSGNAGTYADINVNALHFVAVSNQPTNGANLSGAIKVSYIDN